MQRRFFLAAFTILMAMSAMAQNSGQTVRGIVTEAFTGNPIEGASIIVPDTKPLLEQPPMPKASLS